MSGFEKRLSWPAWLLPLAILWLSAPVPAPGAEPTYGGKPLSDWLVVRASDPAAEDAIRHIGTKGLPTLLELLSATDSNRQRILHNLSSEGLKTAFQGKGADAETLRSLAVDGFAILGTNAEPALPQVIKLFHKGDTCFEAAQVLSEIGPKGFAVLTNAIDNESEGDAVVLNIGSGGDQRAVARLLIHALKSRSWSTRGNAASQLGGKAPDLAVPALIGMLDDPAFYPVDRAVGALESFGPAAKSAAPKLLTLYTNILAGSDKELIRALAPSVLNALRKIDREAAAQAEAFLLKTGPLNGARRAYSVTRLPNGKDLIAGGYVHTEIPAVTNRDLRSAQLLDPKTGQWVETGEMTTERDGHSAILLRNGKVLVVGGSDSKGRDCTSAELYDIATGLWRPTGSLNHVHGNEKAVLEPDGKVRMPGGWDGSKMTDDELYDPNTEKWTVVPKK